MKIVRHLFVVLVTFAVLTGDALCQEHQLAGASPTLAPPTDHIELSAEIIEIDNAKLKDAGVEFPAAMNSSTVKGVDRLKIVDLVDRLEANSAAQRLYSTTMTVKSGNQESYTRHDDQLFVIQADTSANETVVQAHVKSLNGQVARTFEIKLTHESDKSLVVNPGWASLKSDQDKTYCLLFRINHIRSGVKATPVSMHRVDAQRYDISAKYFAIDRKAARNAGVDFGPGDQSSKPKAANGLAIRSFMNLLQRHSIARRTFFPLVSVDPNQVSYTHLAEQEGALDCHLQSIVNKDSSSIDITVTRRTPGKSAKSATYTLDASANKTYSLDINTLFDQANPSDVEHTVVVSVDCVSHAETN